MAEITVISWRAIPAQVIAKEGRTTARVAPPERFQEAIDMAATRVGLTGTDEYLAEWRRVSRPCGPELEQEAKSEAELLDQTFTPAMLDSLVHSGGIEPEDQP